MICITDFLAHIRLTMKLQEQMLKNICENMAADHNRRKGYFISL